MVCPTCKKRVNEPTAGNDPGPYFPFCSERCKLVDLGRWLDGRYQVPVEVTPDDDDAAPVRGER